MIVEFLYDHNKKIKKGDIPYDTTKLVFSHDYNKKINIGVLPPNITDIIFGNGFNQILDVGVFPKSVVYIKFGYKYNHRTFGRTPPPINEDIPSMYNQIINPGVLPPHLAHLILSDNYNQPFDIGVLPNSLLHITFGEYFDRLLLIDNTQVLPNDINKICFRNSHTVIDPKAIPHNAIVYKITV